MNLENNKRVSSELTGLDRPLHLVSEVTDLPKPGAFPQIAPKPIERKRLFWHLLADDFRQRFPLLAGLFMCCVASYFLASRYMVCTVVIRGRSMTPTLRDGDQYLLNRIAYLFREPLRGDLVVLHDPGHTDMAIKRIVGLPGDTIEAKNGSIFVNGKKLPEPYLAPSTLTSPGHALKHVVQLGAKSYFVMGDNRSESEDSRFYGPIQRDNIVGVVSL